MRGLRRPTVVFMTVVLASGLAACGDGGDDTESGSEEPAAVTTTASATGTDAVDIVMADYSYTISGNLNAGGTIRLSNTGKEFHMMGLGRLKPGKTLADLTTILQSFAEGPPGGEGEGPTTTAVAGSATTTTAGATGPSTTSSETQGEGEGEEEGDPTLEVVDEVGAPGAFMGPGQKAEITVPSLGAGTYALVCFIPVEGGGPPHFAQGMVGQLTVVGAKAKAPTADATFKLEAGKAITGPATLTAGKRVLKFEAAPGGEQLEPGLVRLDANTTIADINRAFEAFETEDDFVLPLKAASLIPGDLIAGVFDFGSATEVYLGVNLTAGTYGIDGHDSDPEDSPVDPVEQLTFTVT